MIRDLTKQITIAENVVLARSHWSRMRGMLGRNFDSFDAMVFEKNNSIHMFFMHMPLDILFLDSEKRVVGMRHSLKPWRLAMEVGAVTTIELPAGTLKEQGIELGDQLDLECDTVY